MRAIMAVNNYSEQPQYFPPKAKNFLGVMQARLKCSRVNGL